MNHPKHCRRSELVFVLLPALTLVVALGAPAGALQQMEPKEFAQGVEYKLLMSRDDKVCTHMLALFNSDLKQYGYEKYDAHEEFRSIGWKKESIVRMEGDRQVMDTVEAAHFDINNDGTKDVVFRRTDFYGGYERHILYIFPSIATSDKKWTLMEIAHSPGRISLYNQTYPLGQLSPKGQIKPKTKSKVPPTATGLSVLEPFILHGTTYISMRALYELVGFDPAHGFARMHVITKYRQGKFGGGPEPNEPQTGETQDICYYQVRTKKFGPGGE